MFSWILSPSDAGYHWQAPFWPRSVSRASRTVPPAGRRGKKNAEQLAKRPFSNHGRFDMTYKATAKLLLIVVSIAGCATDPLTRSDCDWAQPIKPSRKDVLTRQTKEQIAAHNEAGMTSCGWRTQLLISR
jgi:hypothetical protein